MGADRTPSAACTCARLSGDPGSYPCPVHPEFGAATVAGPVIHAEHPAAQGRPKKRGHVVLEAFVDASAEHDLGRYLEDVRRTFANDFSCYVHELYPDARVHARVTVEGE